MKALLACVLCVTALALARGDELPATVVQALARAQVPLSATAVVVQPVGPGPARLMYHADQAINPASVMKLVTTFAALDMLGPAYQWRTGVYATGHLRHGVLEGDLILQGGGDPKLVMENLWLLLRRVRDMGIRDVRGDIVLDRSAFAVPELDPGRFDNDPSRPYNVGPDALLLNFKSVSLRFLPDGDTVHVAAEPPLAGLRLPSTVRAAPGECGDWKSQLQANLDDPLHPRFAGRYRPACGDKAWNLAPLPRDAYARALLAPLWHDVGGRLGGTIRAGALPSDARKLFDWQSPPLAEVVRDINKFSNNVMARQLFLSLALAVTQQPATPEAAVAVVTDWAARRGLSMPELVLENGSGLSRRERISAASLARLLQAAYASAVMPELMSSLPVVGEDGTMKKRTSTVSRGSAHIKTGSLRDVRSMAGYVLAADGRRYVVVALVNDEHAAGAQDAFDALLDYVWRGAE